MNQFNKKIHEIAPREKDQNFLVEDKQGNKYEIFSSYWSGYSAYCIDHNGEIITNEKTNYFGQKRLVKKCITITYNSVGYKLVSQAMKE